MQIVYSIFIYLQRLPIMVNLLHMKAAVYKILLFGIVSLFSTNIQAYTSIQAESYFSMFGVQLENNNTTVGYIDSGDWMYYKDVDFGTGASSIILSAAKSSVGGSLELHLDSKAGTLIATFYPENNSSWTSFVEQTCNIVTTSGIHSLYIVASGATGVCNLDYFRLSDVKIPEPNWVQVWADEFNGNDVDGNSWQKINKGNNPNNELQFYTTRAQNIEVSNGTLKLIARKESYSSGGIQRNYTSGKIDSQNKLTFKYGKFEARMKLPRGKGTWPAFWMLGQNISSAGWPKCGEIDVMEHAQDLNNLGAAIHTQAYNHTIGTQKTGTYQISDYDTGFHIYGVEWSAEKLSFKVDGNAYFTITKAQLGSTEAQWPFDQPFFLILNHAVGGAWGGTPDDSLYPHTTEVDWVRVYQDVSLSTFDESMNDLESGITLYPNPSSDVVTVNFLRSSLHDLSMKLLDSNGKVLQKINKVSPSETLRLQSYSTGTYFLIVTQENQIIKTFKILRK